MVDRSKGFQFPRKRYMIPLDEEFKWVNIKQKPFRQI